MIAAFFLTQHWKSATCPFPCFGKGVLQVRGSTLLGAVFHRMGDSVVLACPGGVCLHPGFEERADVSLPVLLAEQHAARVTALVATSTGLGAGCLEMWPRSLSILIAKQRPRISPSLKAVSTLLLGLLLPVPKYPSAARVVPAACQPRSAQGCAGSSGKGGRLLPCPQWVLLVPFCLLFAFTSSARLCFCQRLIEQTRLWAH